MDSKVLSNVFCNYIRTWSFLFFPMALHRMKSGRAPECFRILLYSLIPTIIMPIFYKPLSLSAICLEKFLHFMSTKSICTQHFAVQRIQVKNRLNYCCFFFIFVRSFAAFNIQSVWQNVEHIWTEHSFALLFRWNQINETTYIACVRWSTCFGVFAFFEHCAIEVVITSRRLHWCVCVLLFFDVISSINLRSSWRQNGLLLYRVEFVLVSIDTSAFISHSFESHSTGSKVHECRCDKTGINKVIKIQMSHLNRREKWNLLISLMWDSFQWISGIFASQIAFRLIFEKFSKTLYFRLHSRAFVYGFMPLTKHFIVFLLIAAI